MLIIACDTTSPLLGLAVCDGEQVLAELTLRCGKTHSEVFLPAMTDLLRQAEVSLDAIDLYAVADGPGSYTGIRIGLAAIGALAWARGKPVYGVSVLEALAWPWLRQPETLVGAQIDARNRRVFSAAWHRGSQILPEANRSQADWIAELSAQTSADRRGTLICAGFAGLPEDERELRERLREQSPHWQMIRDAAADHPLPRNLAGIAWQRCLNGDPGDPAALNARYVSLSAAARLQSEQNSKKESASQS